MNRVDERCDQGKTDLTLDEVVDAFRRGNCNPQKNSLGDWSANCAFCGKGRCAFKENGIGTIVESGCDCSIDSQIAEIEARARGDKKKPNGKTKTAFKDEYELVFYDPFVEDPEPEEWLIEGWFPSGGLAIIGGRGGVGKSQIAIDIACSVAFGNDWNGHRCKQGKVIYVSSEDRMKKVVIPRFRAACSKGVPGAVCLLTATKEVATGEKQTFSLVDDIQRVRKKLDALKGQVRLIVIDPVTQYMGAKIDTYRDTEVRAVLEPWSRLADEYDLCILVVAHTRKGLSGHGGDNLAGSMGFRNMTRALYMVGKDPETGERTIACDKLNTGPDAESLTYDIVTTTVMSSKGVICPTTRIKWTGTSETTSDELMTPTHQKPGPKPDKLAEAEEWLVDQFILNKTIPANDLYERAKESNITQQTLRNARQSLNGRGVSKGKYGIQKQGLGGHVIWGRS